MLKELEYPFDSQLLLKKSKGLRRRLLEDGSSRITKKVAVLGGSTTHDIVRIMELFLLNHGIEPFFYESEFGRYWEDVIFESPELKVFSPDIIYIHTSNRNITEWPQYGTDRQQADEMADAQSLHFRQLWERIADVWHCPVIQNNFEYPYYRLMGNQDGVLAGGRTAYVNRLNTRFAEYAEEHANFYINDINYQSAVYGLDAWADPLYWHMYKYCLCLQAIPWLAHNVSNIIKSIFGKNKKALVLDMDHTLWGGVVGDDGPENLEIGPETSMGQVYSEFQSYLKELETAGIMLNISSKNEEENALAGLKHPCSKLRPDDFIIIKANWEPKSENILTISKELNILTDSLVFVDDNPAEREIVSGQVRDVTVPEIEGPESYIRILDHGGYFETTTMSADDRNRNEMYKANMERVKQQEAFADYGEYLQSLHMTAVIRPFESVYISRIAQLTNKSNQFNLTTKRYTQAEIEQTASDPSYITLYGKLEDKFGDNGVVTVVIGHKRQKEDGRPCLDIVLWLMSCRVLKRDMEFAMMDKLAGICQKENIEMIYGYYYPTAKNKMVKEFYAGQGFSLVSESPERSVWVLTDLPNYVNINKYITVNQEDQER